MLCFSHPSTHCSTGISFFLLQFSAYTSSIYWTIATFTTTGYGDLHANTTTEKLVAVAFMLAGKLFFAFVLGKAKNRVCECVCVCVCE